MAKSSHSASSEDGCLGLRFEDPVVLQVENARVVKKGSSLVHPTAEFSKDSQNASAWAQLQPKHAKATELRALSCTVGERMLVVTNVYQKYEEVCQALTAEQSATHQRVLEEQVWVFEALWVPVCVL